MSVTQLGFAHDIDRANGKEEWLTPPELIKSLGEFDLDPCSPINRPWPIAKEHYTISDNGLVKPWIGRVWCNPPYGPETGKWMARCMAHKNCTALIFARTETRQFFEYVWGGAYAVLFIKGRLSFYHVTGQQGGTAGAPSVLVAFDESNANALLAATTTGKINGHYIKL